jgi:magnesium-transporting ATPase (P-type)
VPEIIPYLAFVIFRIPLPLTIIQILAVDLGTDMLPALGLGAEKPGPEIMNSPPRARHERLLHGALLARAYLFLGLMQATAAMCAYGFVLRGGGWHAGQLLAANDPLYLQATTACLSAIVVMQIANVFLCQSARLPVTSRGISSNKLILAGVATEIALILLIDYTAWGNALFGTAPISFSVWLFIIPFAIAMVVLEELRKWICRSAFTREPPLANEQTLRA